MFYFTTLTVGEQKNETISFLFFFWFWVLTMLTLFFPELAILHMNWVVINMEFRFMRFFPVTIFGCRWMKGDCSCQCHATALYAIPKLSQHEHFLNSWSFYIPELIFFRLNWNISNSICWYSWWASSLNVLQLQGDMNLPFSHRCIVLRTPVNPYPETLDNICDDIRIDRR